MIYEECINVTSLYSIIILLFPFFFIVQPQNKSAVKPFFNFFCTFFLFAQLLLVALQLLNKESLAHLSQTPCRKAIELPVTKIFYFCWAFHFWLTSGVLYRLLDNLFYTCFFYKKNRSLTPTQCQKPQKYNPPSLKNGWSFINRTFNTLKSSKNKLITKLSNFKTLFWITKSGQVVSTLKLSKIASWMSSFLVFFKYYTH